MNTPSSRILSVVGSDIGSHVVWTWQWHDDSQPHHTLLDRADVDSAIADFRTELPKAAQVAARRLSNRDAEFELTKTLADSVLPEPLREEIDNRCSESSVGLFRIIPPPSVFVVPWGLLPISGEQRLIEVMDVVQVAPPLSRDGSEERPQAWNPRDDGALRVIDPLVVGHDGAPRWVLLEVVDRAFDAELYRWSEMDGYSSDDFRPELPAVSLSELLKAKTYSHWLWVGHVEAQGKSQVSELVLTGGNLSAATLFSDGPGVWPMPARVGLVACESGADSRHAEPFGLVVAALEAGAELVIGTLWTLPTDLAFAVRLGATTVDEFKKMKKPFNDAALVVDEIMRDPDPVRALGDWQRAQLEQWRANGDVLDSPVIWAALTAYDAPDRTVRVG